MIKSYKDLEIYQTSYGLALRVYQLTKEFPEHEKYEIGSQMRRATLSIPLNIAEGYGKKSSSKDFIRFLSIALGSSNEVMVLIDFIKDLGYIDEKNHKELISQYDVVGKRIYKLMNSWQ